jgi:hypothetical protein
MFNNLDSFSQQARDLQMHAKVAELVKISKQLVESIEQLNARLTILEAQRDLIKNQIDKVVIRLNPDAIDDEELLK